jgi:AcrR family transcriptional regulator
LIGEKPYDAIVVKEILHRANVGRSTFYTHFRDKDELLVDGIQDMLRFAQPNKTQVSTKQSERVVSFARPILEYHERHLGAGRARMTPAAQTTLHVRLHEILSRQIADDLRREGRGHRRSESEITPELIGKHVASTFILVLNWWIATHRSLPAYDVDCVFRALILPTLVAILD